MTGQGPYSIWSDLAGISWIGSATFMATIGGFVLAGLSGGWLVLSLLSIITEMLVAS